MAEYGAIERAAAKGIIADAAKAFLRDAERAGGESAARGAARDGAEDAARTSSERIGKELTTKSRIPQFEGEERGVRTPVGGNVRYLDDGERQAFKLEVRDGRLVGADGAAFDTAGAASVHAGGGGRAIYVMDPEGNVYASTFQQVGVFHHSSFLAGGDVAGAGELVVHDGRLETISTRSGHYQPTDEMQDQVLRELQSRGLDVSHVRKEGW